MMIPNDVAIYGSRSLFTLTSGEHEIIGIPTLSRKMRKYINQDKEPCTNSISPDTSGCIARWIQEKIACRVKIYGGGGNLDHLPPCNSITQLRELTGIIDKFMDADAKIIKDQTGCLASCELYEYEKLEHVRYDDEMKNFPCSKGNSSSSCDFNLMLEIPKQEITYEGTKQYVVYDFNSFIADVGGYMGLLLGYSILGLYDELHKMFKKWKFVSMLK